MEPAPGIPSALASQGDPVYRTVYASVEDSVEKGHALRGSLLWELYFRIYEASPASPYGVGRDGSTFDIVAQHAQRLKVQAARLEAGRPECSGGGGGEEAVECWEGVASLYYTLTQGHKVAVEAKNG